MECIVVKKVRGVSNMSGQKTLTERKGIHSLEGLLLNTGRILTYFKEGDKRVSWDGEIELYPNTSAVETKNMLGKIPVQFKSTSAFNDSKTISEEVNLKDLLNYRNYGGCLYFIICNCGGGETQIYYNALLPCDINAILEQTTKVQQKKSIRFNRFPADNEIIIALLYSFIENRKKQTSDENCKFMIDKLNKEHLNSIDFFTFSLQGTDNDPFISIFDIPTYVYAKPKVGGLIPFKKIYDVGEITIGDIPVEVLLDGKKYYDQIRVSKTKGSEIIKIGWGCTFDKNGTINYQPTGTLFDRIKDTNFFSCVIENPNKELKIGTLASAIINEAPSAEFVAEWERYLKSLLAIKEALEYFGVYFDLDFDKLTEEEFKIIDALITASKGGKFKQNPSPTSAFCNLQIANLNIAILIKEENGEFSADNAFKSDLKNAKIISDDGIENESSIFVILKKDNLIKLSNIDYSVMKKSIVSKEYAPLYSASVNLLLLETLLAYDEISRPELLDFALYISEWLVSHEKLPGDMLNNLQTIKRSRALVTEEINLLVNIKNAAANYNIALGACILLESYLEADHYWENLTEDERITFSQYPIFSLWKEKSLTLA